MRGHFQHFGDNIARFSDDDSVADGNVFFADEIFVVKRCAADGRAGKQYGGQHGCRCKHARSADVDFNIQQCGFFFFGRIFKSHRPFREFGGAAERLTLCEVIDLNDRAVNIKRQGVADFADALNLGECVLDCADLCVKRYGFKAERF